MKNSLRNLLLVGLLPALAGCASTEIHYHTLTPVGGVGSLLTPERNPAPAGYALEVLPVGLPALVDRQELVVRQDEKIVILDGERWAGALGDELHDTLSALLQQRLVTQDVSGIVVPAKTPVLRVKVMVRDFQSAPGYYALLDADWSLTRSDSPLLAHPVCHSRFSVSPQKPGYGALALAHQEVLSAMSQQIADTARSWMINGEAACAHTREG
jgi:uncharacterized lipoprotein YmbA